MGPQRIHLDAKSPYIYSRQLGWRFRSIQQMSLRKHTDLFYTGPMSLTRSKQKELREQFVKIFEEISLQVVNEDPETLCCLNLDLFEF